MKKNQRISVKGTEINIFVQDGEDYISLTDMVKRFGEEIILYNWFRNKNTIEFLGIWEAIYNPNFNPIEFDRIKSEAGLNRFSLSPKKWIDTTNAIGIISRSGRYGGGTFAHKDIAFEFGSWLSPEFKLYLIKEFQRLKDEENAKLLSEWSIQRTLAKVNYKIHTDAIKENLIPAQITKNQINKIYASEADILNVALFGKTAKEWQSKSPSLNGNMRDYASIEQLVVLSNLESLNSILIRQGLSQSDRLLKLNEIAIVQMTSLLKSKTIKKLSK
jgi:hypothetical protein